jgi:hypothetical protein
MLGKNNKDESPGKMSSTGIRYYVCNPMDKLADRLRWEPTANGIQVLIPARLDWKILFFAVWIVMWTVGGIATIRQFLNEIADNKSDSFLALWLIGWAAGECFVTATIIWAVGGKTLLRLDPATMTIEHQLFGIRFLVRSFATAEVRNLRLTQAVRKGRSYTASHISFESGDKTRSFASGISDAEAFALIDKMLKVYPFAKERALEYLDLSR